MCFVFGFGVVVIPTFQVLSCTSSSLPLLHLFIYCLAPSHNTARSWSTQLATVVTSPSILLFSSLSLLLAISEHFDPSEYTASSLAYIRHPTSLPQPWDIFDHHIAASALMQYLCALSSPKSHLTDPVSEHQFSKLSSTSRMGDFSPRISHYSFWAFDSSFDLDFAEEFAEWAFGFFFEIFWIIFGILPRVVLFKFVLEISFAWFITFFSVLPMLTIDVQ